ncbi:oxygenase MpaB family protein [Gordonia sp. CPCC 206044]|uniref:oxygenase MpaB family protein n=1 Tax=Gordonia sp. CPCC 206044 TaxID=3140793 RepID=UPI003AF37A59
MDAASITGARNWDAVRADHPEVVKRLEDGLLRSDDAADAVIAEMYERSMAWPQLLAAVDTGSAAVEVPPALAALLDAAGSSPPWFDAALADAGARAWWRFGTLQSSTLYQSLIYGYKAQGFVRPLAATGRLGDGTLERVQNTARWVAEATTPGAMAPRQPGWVATIRIRLLHALIRDHLRTDRSGTGQVWDDEAWGIPINQTYSQLTITGGFLVLPLIVARDLGIRYSSAEREAICHLWRWIGYVIGVDEDRLPVDFSDARELFTIAAEFELEPDAVSKRLTRALLRDGFDLHNALPLPAPMVTMMGLFIKPVLSTSFSSISTRWVERPAAGALGLRRTPLHHLVDVARPAVRLREVVRATGLLGSESAVVRRELRTVRRGLGLPPVDDPPLTEVG